MSTLDPPQSRPPRGLAVSGLFVGPAAFAILLFLPPPAGLSGAAWATVAVVALMATWWFTQAIPLGATALLPAILFPVLGIGGLSETTAAYAHPLIFLFFGGFVVALTIQRWDLHRRIAVAIIGRAGTRPAALMGGFMLATAGLSMWVSNTATTLMMVPIALSVVAFVGSSGQGRDRSGEIDDVERFARGLLIAIAYAASIGGLATLIGTPPNALLAGYMNSAYGLEIGFGHWMVLGLPVSAVLLLIAWGLISRVFYRTDGLSLTEMRDGIGMERARLGPMGRGECMTAALFAAVALAWVCQPVLARVVPLSDTGIALAAALAAFVLPVKLKERVFLMDWAHAVKLPWEILLLFGGGLSLAGAIDTTGLAAWLGGLLTGIGILPVLVTIAVLTGMVVFLTELTSNTATAAVFIPVSAAMAGSLGLDPMILAVPVALAASCAFMMPVATPPNAIVFSAGRLTVVEMCRAGMVMNIVGTAIIAAAAMWLLPMVFPAG